MSGVGFLVKSFTSGGRRRRRRLEEQERKLELPDYGQCRPDVVPCWNAIPPITPPAAFRPFDYSKKSIGERICLCEIWYKKLKLLINKAATNRRVLIRPKRCFSNPNRCNSNQMYFQFFIDALHD